MRLLSVLEGATVFTSIAALVALSAALIESWVHRRTTKHPDYALAISLLSMLAIAGWLVTVGLIGNYVWRFYRGLPGSTVAGPVSNSVVSLGSFVFTFSFFTLVGTTLLYLLWVSDIPTEEERSRRKRVAKRRVEVERLVRARRNLDSRVIPRRGDGSHD